MPLAAWALRGTSLLTGAMTREPASSNGTPKLTWYSICISARTRGEVFDFVVDREAAAVELRRDRARQSQLEEVKPRFFDDRRDLDLSLSVSTVDATV